MMVWQSIFIGQMNGWKVNNFIHVSSAVTPPHRIMLLLIKTSFQQYSVTVKEVAVSVTY